MGLEGIAKIQKAILELPSIMSRASTDAAAELEDVIEQQFAQGIDPYGNAWAELKPSTLQRGRTPPPGTDTGALRAVHVTPLQSAGIRVEFDEQYASFYGAKRPLVPNADSFASSSWYRAIVVGYSNAILKNGGWRAAGADVEDDAPMSHAAE